MCRHTDRHATNIGPPKFTFSFVKPSQCDACAHKTNPKWPIHIYGYICASRRKERFLRRNSYTSEVLTLRQFPAKKAVNVPLVFFKYVGIRSPALLLFILDDYFLDGGIGQGQLNRSRYVQRESSRNLGHTLSDVAHVVETADGLITFSSAMTNGRPYGNFRVFIIYRLCIARNI